MIVGGLQCIRTGNGWNNHTPNWNSWESSLPLHGQSDNLQQSTGMNTWLSRISHPVDVAVFQSRSQSFVPLDQRSGNESIRLTAQSQTTSMACYGACLKWLLPELSFSDRWSRARSSGNKIGCVPALSTNLVGFARVLEYKTIYRESKSVELLTSHRENRQRCLAFGVRDPPNGSLI